MASNFQQAALRCCKHRHKELGPNVKASICYPILKAWLKTSRATPQTPEHHLPVQMGGILDGRDLVNKFPLSHNLCSFVRESEHLVPGGSPLGEFNRSVLSSLLAEARVQNPPYYCLVVSLKTGHAAPDDLAGWADKCTTAVKSFLDQFTETSVPCYADVNSGISAILASPHPGVSHNISTNVSENVLFGYKDRVNELLTQINDYIHANHVGKCTRRISAPMRAFIDHCHPAELVLRTVSYMTSEDAIVAEGTARDCEMFFSTLDSLSLAEIVVCPSSIKTSLLLSKPGRALFTSLADDRNIRATYLSKTHDSICIVADRTAVKVARDILEVAISVHSILVPRMFSQWCSSKKWLDFRLSVQSKFTVSIEEGMTDNKVHVLYNSRSGDPQNRALTCIESYIHSHCDKKAAIQLAPKQWQCLCQSKAWCSIEELLQNRTRAVPYLEGPNPRIELQGDDNDVEKVEKKIREACQSFCQQEDTVSTPGAAKLLMSLPKGRQLLQRLELEHNVVIECTTHSEEFTSYNVQDLPGYREAIIPCCCDVGINCRLFLKVGELAAYPGQDVVVNSADDSLRLTSQVAVDFAALNEKGFQAECARVRKSPHHLLKQGEVISLKLGYEKQLHPKAILLVLLKPVCPDSDGEVERVSDVVERCLQAAEGHNGVTFPLLGTEGNDRELATASSEGMLKGISKYFKQNPHSSLKTIEILLPNDTVHATTIVSFMKSVVGNTWSKIGGDMSPYSERRRPSRRKKGKELDSMGTLHSHTSNGLDIEVVEGDFRRDDSAGVFILGDIDQSQAQALLLSGRRILSETIQGKAYLSAPVPIDEVDCSQIVYSVLQRAEKRGIRSLAIVNRLPDDLLWDSREAISKGMDKFADDQEHKSLKSSRLFVEIKNKVNFTEKRTMVKVKISSLNPQHSKQALTELKETISRLCPSKRVDNQTIPNDVEKKLKAEALRRDAQVCVSQSERSVTFAGCSEDVEALIAIMAVSLDIPHSKIRWQWKDEEGLYRDYGLYESNKIESAHLNGGQYYHAVGVETMFIDFEKMTEQRQNSDTFVRRLDLESQEGMPGHWDHVPTSAQYKCFTLERQSQEFIKVAHRVQNSLACASHAAAVKFDRIVLIERVQNWDHWKKFTQEGAKRLTQEGKDTDTEKQKETMFFGCPGGNVQKVFEGKFVRTNKRSLGNGVNFSKKASDVCTAAIAPKDNNDVQHIFQCQVITGRFTKGRNNLTEPPLCQFRDARGEMVRYDSVVDREEDPQLYMVFADDRAYPEYHIEYSTTPAQPVQAPR